MLKGIDPLLSGELLHALDDLGHGELLAVVDRNFPAYSSGSPVVRVESDAVSVVRAVLGVFPLDDAEKVSRMQVGDDSSIVHPQARAVGDLVGEDTAGWDVLPRFDFYAHAARARLVILTRETEPYANFVFAKGVIAS